jgi:hypothetical protein
MGPRREARNVCGGMRTFQYAINLHKVPGFGCWRRIALVRLSRPASPSEMPISIPLVLPAHDEDGKAAGNDGWTGARIVGSWVGAGAEFGGDQVDAIGGGVIGHGAGAALGGQALDSGVAGGCGIDYGENSLAAGGEGELMGRVPAGAVGAVADGGVASTLPVIGVDYGHLLAVADREEAVAAVQRRRPDRWGRRSR